MSYRPTFDLSTVGHSASVLPQNPVGQQCPTLREETGRTAAVLAEASRPLLRAVGRHCLGHDIGSASHD